MPAVPLQIAIPLERLVQRATDPFDFATLLRAPLLHPEELPTMSRDRRLDGDAT